MVEFGKAALSRNLEQLLQAIRLCRERELLLPALLVTFTGIEILASLSPPAPDASGRRCFVAWTEAFLLPNSGLAVSGLDLYASRCAIVHSGSSQSKLERDGEARRIVYAMGPTTAEELQRAIENIGDPARDVAVEVDAVLDAFERAVWNFKSALLRDPDLRDRVDRNAGRLLPGISFGPGFSLLDIRMT